MNQRPRRTSSQITDRILDKNPSYQIGASETIVRERNGAFGFGTWSLELGTDELLRVQVIIIIIDNVSIEVKSNDCEVESFTRSFLELRVVISAGNGDRKRSYKKAVKSKAIQSDYVINTYTKRKALSNHIRPRDVLQNDKLLLLLLFAIFERRS